jgi:S-adenosylmethionine synthetase
VPSRSLFTSESVTEGHPDKVADQISDAILDAVLSKDPEGRVACETLLTKGLAVVAGETSTTASIDVTAITRETILRIGYDRPEVGLDGNSCGVVVALNSQSPDIAQGVTQSYEQRQQASRDPLDSQGAGDQGMMFGYACTDTQDLLPAPIWLAHRLAERLAQVRKQGILPYLGPDGKTQVTCVYSDGNPVAVETILIAAQHQDLPGIDSKLTSELRHYVVEPTLEGYFAIDGVRLLVNPTGSFIVGGPTADTGLTGRKIIVDTYGGMSRHGGGAFSGKDPSKVDRSASYAARWVAKNVVAAGAATRCEVQLAYAIGMARPVSIRVETFSTSVVDPARIVAAVQEVFDLRPAAIIRDLDLRRPIYNSTAAYGHFGRTHEAFTWEATNKAAELKVQLGI